jgi:maltose alpha-D-glucosyltransferase/alpha-amylase
MVAEWSYPADALDNCFHVDFFHWFKGYNDLFQKESWRILNGVSEGHSYFDAEGKGDITAFLRSYMDQYEKTVGKGYISLPLGNHDNARLGNRRTDKELEMIYAFGFTMPGVPFLYYGNEIGMKQLPNDWPQVEGAYQPRNGARTPMQWNGGKNLGFSSGDAGKLYLPVDPSPDAPNVEAQEKNPNSLLNKTRRLIALRHSEPALANYAEFVPVYPSADAQAPSPSVYPFVYARAAGKDVVLVMLNPRAEASDAVFHINVKFGKTKLLAGDSFPMKHNKKTGDMTIHMPATSYAVVKLLNVNL